jgi:competence protein ComGC
MEETEREEQPPVESERNTGPVAIIAPECGAEIPPKAPRRRKLNWEVIIFLNLIGVLGWIAGVNFHRARDRANTRACYANQKTIAGAVEMYCLDKNTKRELDVKLVQTMISGGYLRSIPSDPGQGGMNYYTTTGGNGIACKFHGAIQEDEGGKK